MKIDKEEHETEFRKVYDRQFSRLYKLAWFLLGDREDAQDAVQLAFTRFWEKHPRFRDTDHENAWFLTVTRNLCRDMQKEYYRRNRTDLESAPEDAVPFAYEEDNALWQAVRKLPEKQREIVYLYYYEEYSVRELSGILHQKESTLQTRLADARKKLRSILETEEKEA